jgi:hypothetical protein
MCTRATGEDATWRDSLKKEYCFPKCPRTLFWLPRRAMTESDVFLSKNRFYLILRNWSSFDQLQKACEKN